MGAVDTWANFLANEYLHPRHLHPADTLTLISFCQLLAKVRGPKTSPHAAKIETRRFLCSLAMDIGLDLTKIRKRSSGKMAMGRGLLDAWNQVYLVKYGGLIGTAGLKEVQRRGVSTKLAKERRDGESVSGDSGV